MEIKKQPDHSLYQRAREYDNIQVSIRGALHPEDICVSIIIKKKVQIVNNNKIIND